MHRLKNNNITKIFIELIKSQNIQQIFKNSCTTKSFSLSKMKYCISVRGPKLWNDFLQNEEKEIRSYSFFQKTVKSKLIETENEVTYF